MIAQKKTKAEFEKMLRTDFKLPICTFSAASTA